MGFGGPTKRDPVSCWMARKWEGIVESINPPHSFIHKRSVAVGDREGYACSINRQVDPITDHNEPLVTIEVIPRMEGVGLLHML